MRSPIFAVVPLLFVAATADAQALPEEFRKAWPDFRYLEPKQLRQVPAPVRADLEARGCRVPMFTKWDGPHNAISGQFLQAGRQDWAVLCASDGKTTILVYPGGAADAVQPLRSEESDPRRFLHAVSAFVLSKRALRDQQGELPVQSFDHDAIEDGPIGEPGRVVYHRAGEWMLL
jgi:hypothetical protein